RCRPSRLRSCVSTSASWDLRVISPCCGVSSTMMTSGMLPRIDRVPSIFTCSPVAIPSSELTLRVPATDTAATLVSITATMNWEKRMSSLDAHDRVAQQQAPRIVCELELAVLPDQPGEDVEISAGAMHVTVRGGAGGVTGHQQRAEIGDDDRRIIEACVAGDSLSAQVLRGEKLRHHVVESLA